MTVIVLVVLGVATFLVNQIFAADHKRVMALHQVEYANKMASLGRLSAGVAHEINNPLAIINEKAGLIKDLFTLGRQAPEASRLLGLVDGILYSADRCSAITRRLLNFARHMVVRPQRLNVGAIVQEVLGFLGKEAEFRSIAVSVQVDPDVPPIESDPGRLQEIFLNLINNALAAMADGGCLAITASRPDDGWVCVRVADTGCGIPEADMHRIFEPFFSTKTASGGTGLGLSITYGLIQEIGGHIRVKSEMGKGTEFSVFLPHQMPPLGKVKDASPAG
jgi:signal transduction histidine kinase